MRLANAQNGYVNSAGLCGFPNGVRIGYNLLTHKSLNLYLDTDALMIRQVNLDPPGPRSAAIAAEADVRCGRGAVLPRPHAVGIRRAGRARRGADGDGDRAQRRDPRARAGQQPDPGLRSRRQSGQVLQAAAGPAFPRARSDGRRRVSRSRRRIHRLPVRLSKDANNAHRLDIYHPSHASTSPICTTHGVTAAKLAVDFWRRAYLLNYEVLQLPNGGGIPAFTEPSVSLWLPTPPPT